MVLDSGSFDASTISSPLIRLQEWMGVQQSASMALGQTNSIAEIFQQQKARLQNFIRGRVANPIDAEDILQDVFYELVEADWLAKPIEQAGAWLFRVARNKITDSFRKKRPETMGDGTELAENGVGITVELLLPSAENSPEAAYARGILLEEIEEALDELPEEQRAVFVAHELEGRSFKDLAAATGLSVNTLLSRKRYAVLHLRTRLRGIYDEFKRR